jgi:LPS export ABC transporter protein LptC
MVPFSFFKKNCRKFSAGISLIFLVGCSFDYGETAKQTGDQPDIVMNDLEYVRVRNGDPIVRFTAESAERYEKKQLMDVKTLEFEQFHNHGEEVNVQGVVGSAKVEIDTGNIQMENGISLKVATDDFSIKTDNLRWEDKTRALSAGKDDEVIIERSDGTSFSGAGFSANARDRSFSFDGGISGIYVQEDEE